MEEDFDPATPSIAREAAAGYPLSIPWLTRPVRLGTSFESALLAAPNPPGPWLEDCAFDEAALHSAPVVFTQYDGGRAFFTQSASINSEANERHLTVGLKSSVGCPFLNASVSGQYNKDVGNNKDAIKTSVQSSHRAGTVHFIGDPMSSSFPCPFSKAALSTLPRHSAPHSILTAAHEPSTRSSSSAALQSSFRALYGDYFVSGYRIGGDASAMLSHSSSLESNVDAVNLTVSAHAPFIGDKSKTVASHAWTKASAGRALRVTAFDTLTSRHQRLFCGNGAGDAVGNEGQGANGNGVEATVQDIQNTCSDFAELGRVLPYRITKELARLELEDGKAISTEQQDAVCMSGLVVEILLSPWKTCREYIQWTGGVIAG